MKMKLTPPPKFSFLSQRIMFPWPVVKEAWYFQADGLSTRFSWPINDSSFRSESPQLLTELNQEYNKIL